jgi:hypothetical protein
MKRRNVLFTLGLVLSFWAMGLTNFGMAASGAYMALAGKVKMTAGTPVILRLPVSINSSTARQGDAITFEVARDVEVDGKVVISQGAIATGEVASVEKRAMLGEGGKLMVNLRSVRAVDGKEVPIRATLSQEGKNKQVTAILVGLVLCILGLFLIKGGDAIIPSGTEVKAYVDVNVDIEVNT